MQPYMIENLFGIEGWNIAWYGVIIGVGIILGLALASYRAKKYNEKPEIIYDFILIALPVSIICARAYYVIFSGKNTQILSLILVVVGFILWYFGWKSDGFD